MTIKETSGFNEKTMKWYRGKHQHSELKLRKLTHLFTNATELMQLFFFPKEQSIFLFFAAMHIYISCISLYKHPPVKDFS